MFICVNVAEKRLLPFLPEEKVANYPPQADAPQVIVVAGNKTAI